MENSNEPTEEGKSDDNGQHSLGLQDLYRAAFEYTSKSEEGSYEVYAMKPVTFADNSTPSFNNNSTMETYEALDNRYSSVLDLDKGVTIEAAKTDDVNSVTAYVCDSQILQRYLHDASVSLCKDENGQATFAPRPLLTDDGGGLGIAPEKLGVKYSDCDFNSSDSFASTESIIPKNIQCPFCPKTFMFKADLTRHKKHKHTPKQKFVCFICHKEFVCQQNLSIHERSHKKIPDLSCHQCSQAFRSHKQFVTHMEIVHEDQTPYHCGLCPLAYRKASDLLIHHKKFHGNDSAVKKEVTERKSLSCPTCGKKCDKKKNLTAHMKQHLENSYQCGTCGKLFKTESALANHSKKHLAVAKKMAHAHDRAITDLPAHSTNATTVTLFSTTKPGKEFEMTTLKKMKKSHRKKFNCPECSKEFLTRKAMGLHIAAEHIRSTQETCTQTELFELQNVNIAVDSEGNTVQPMLFTPLRYNSLNSVPFILTQPSAISVPFTSSQSQS